MSEFQYIVIFCVILCIDVIAANYNFQQKCPYHVQQHEEDVVPADSVISSIAAAFSEVGETPHLKYETLRPVPINTNVGDSITSWLKNYFSSNAVNSQITNGKKPEKKIHCGIPPLHCVNDQTNFHYRRYDGSCNNLQNPEYGMAKSRYSRMLSPKYSDRVYSHKVSDTGAPLPNARLISLSMYGEDTKPDLFRTMTTLFWGQLAAHDVSHFTTNGAPENCCASINNKLCYPIPLHPNDPISLSSDKTCLHFARSISDAEAICPKSELPYAEKITLATAYLDLSSIYGNSLAQNRKVRLYKSGLLRTSSINNQQFLPVSSNTDGECGVDNYQCYGIPDMRNQFTLCMALLHTVILREHNRLATALAKLNPHYTDEQIFQEARKINIAQYQKITFYDWLPLIIGSAYAYANNLIHNVQHNDYVEDYDVTVNAAPYAEFAAAAFRYNHNQVPGWFSLIAPNHAYNQTLRLSDYFERPENINFMSYGENFDGLIRGLATQLQKRPDSNIDSELKHYFDRKAFEQVGSDLKAIDIQRGRDYGLPSYNDFRHYCGLPRAFDWSGFSNEISAEKIALMQKLYASPNDVDLSVGGSLEAHAPDSILGPTFQCIIGKQFLKARTGDRFFFERDNILAGFTKEQLGEIRKASVSGLFCNNAKSLKFIQPNAFIFPNRRNLLTNCNRIPQLNLEKWRVVQQQTLFK